MFFFKKAFARYYLQFYDDRVAVEAFLSESNRVMVALRGGKLIPGVMSQADAFGR